MPVRVRESVTNLAERPPPQPIPAPTASVSPAMPKIALYVSVQAVRGIRRMRVRVRVRIDPGDAHGEDEVVALAHEARVWRLRDYEHDILERAVHALVPDARDTDARARRPPWGDVHVDLHRLSPRARVGGWSGWGFHSLRWLLGVERARDAVAVHRAEVEILEREMEREYPVFRGR